MSGYNLAYIGYMLCWCNSNICEHIIISGHKQIIDGQPMLMSYISMERRNDISHGPPAIPSNLRAVLSMHKTNSTDDSTQLSTVIYSDNDVKENKYEKYMYFNILKLNVKTATGIGIFIRKFLLMSLRNQ